MLVPSVNAHITPKFPDSFELMVEPDFDNKVFELDARLRGHVSVYKVIVWVLQLYSNDKLKIVIDDVL